MAQTTRKACGWLSTVKFSPEYRRVWMKYLTWEGSGHWSNNNWGPWGQWTHTQTNSILHNTACNSRASYLSIKQWHFLVAAVSVGNHRKVYSEKVTLRRCGVTELKEERRRRERCILQPAGSLGSTYQRSPDVTSLVPMHSPCHDLCHVSSLIWFLWIHLLIT